MMDENGESGRKVAGKGAMREKAENKHRCRVHTQI